MAGHVVADANVGAGQRFQPEMREETGDGVDVFDVEAAAAGDDLKLGRRNEAFLLLSMAQVLDNVPGLASGDVAAVGDLWRSTCHRSLLAMDHLLPHIHSEQAKVVPIKYLCCISSTPANASKK